MQAESSSPSGYTERVVPFLAGDGRSLNLHHVRGAQEPTKGPVVLVHGAGVRANIFRAPVAPTLVDALVADGYDVWLENWRASIDVEPSEWTLDQAAVHDHPPGDPDHRPARPARRGEGHHPLPGLHELHACRPWRGCVPAGDDDRHQRRVAAPGGVPLGPSCKLRSPCRWCRS